MATKGRLRAGAEAFAALIEAARGKPSAVTVAAARALIELGRDEDGGDSGQLGPVTFTLKGSKQVVQDAEPMRLSTITGIPSNPYATRALKALGLLEGIDLKGKIACPRADCPNLTNTIDCAAEHACPLVGPMHYRHRSAATRIASAQLIGQGAFGSALPSVKTCSTSATNAP